ncbi:hypothetical protein [Catenuloplanes atrovinosus]|uniref:Uncharacterized protein n=1 Tax=Catenuloplanes atrovinosus TaxID=137266 RepID=A0AAE4CAG5_9ACTN|nr:hypothetical protein [Catenuloplanes atrovinosus]MDR7277033.1 hypothetical protein [Catenuloplanes atrovinosus]
MTGFAHLMAGGHMGHVPFEQSVDLPPYRAIMAVDAKDFTAEPGSTQETISGLIPSLVGEVFADAGLGQHWNSPLFFGPSGDGFAIGLPTEILPYVIEPVPALLQARLASHNRSVRQGQARLRLRMSLNVGPLPVDSDRPDRTGNGAARNDTHRLLDSRPVKAMLAAASPHVTFLACILSDRVFQDVVAEGYAGRHPDHFLEVPATVEGKSFAQRAWLLVPEVSGNLLAIGLPQSDAGPSSARAPGTPRGIAGPTVRENSGQVATVNHGGMHQGGPR